MQSILFNTHQSLDVKNLCSRKLFEILSSGGARLSGQQRHTVERELVARRHYLQEIQRMRATHPRLLKT